MPDNANQQEILLSRYEDLKDFKTLEGTRFTTRELDIIACSVSGRSAKTIANLLGISPRTVENHMRNVMGKLQCNSREAIIDFVEKSGCFHTLKQHYAYLQSQAAFLQAINVIRKRVQGHRKCLVYAELTSEATSQEVNFLKSALEKLGVTISVMDVSKVSEPKLKEPMGDASLDVVVCYINAFSTSAVSSILQQGVAKAFRVLVKNRPVLPAELETHLNSSSLAVLQHSSIYDLFFQLLQDLFPDIKMQDCIDDFHATYAKLIQAYEQPLAEPKTPELSETAQKHRPKSWPPSKPVLAVSAGLFGLVLLLLTLGLSEDPPTVRSELAIPADANLLKRPDLIHQIGESLKSSAGIQVVAIVGVGGSGKTTLARHFARLQQAPIVWEINAQTQGALENAFENLAQALALSTHGLEQLQNIQATRDLKVRHQKILAFVQERLKAQPGWLLIYDNVESFPNIRKYFPIDDVLWGQGKVVVTSTDSNIENNSHINHTIALGPLKESEQSALFLSIAKDGNAVELSDNEQQQLQAFLERLPPFPLDISTAAYYIKAIQIPFDQYVQHLEHYDQAFEHTQQELLQDVSDYARTRYGIVTLSLKHLMDAHPDFSDLLLLVSLLDSQSIPRSLLDSYKSQVIVDHFIFHLRKHSQFVDESLSHKQPVISIHRSTQGISLVYLKKQFCLSDCKQRLQSIMQIFEQSIDTALETEDFSAMKLLLPHCESLLRHKDLIQGQTRQQLQGDLGCIYYYLRRHDKAKELLQASLSPKHHSSRGSQAEARNLMYLGNVYRELGQFETAKTLLERSQKMYQNYRQDSPGAAKVLGYLGIVYRSLDDYQKAVELLGKSLAIYQKHFPNHVGHAWVLAHLGGTYLILGDYEAARTLLEKSLQLYRQHSEDYVGVSWVLSYLGKVYSKLGDYERAKALLEQSLKICKTHFSGDHVYIASRLASLGTVYEKIGDYKAATQHLQTCLDIYQQHYGDQHIKTAQTLKHLGQVYLHQGQLDQAQPLLLNALEVLEKHHSCSRYLVLESLADLHALKVGTADQKQAAEYFQKALQVAGQYFPENSPHIVRIQDKLKRLG